MPTIKLLTEAAGNAISGPMLARIVTLETDALTESDMTAAINSYDVTMSSTISTINSSLATKASASSVSSLVASLAALNQDSVPDGTTYKQYSATEKTKLAGLSNPISWVPASATRSIVTGTGATGTQISTANNTLAIYSINIGTTATIGGNSDGYAVLEICSTNSSTPANWIEVCRTRNAQQITLAVALQSIQNNTVPLIGPVPKGWYSKIRSVTTSGTVNFSYVSGSEMPMS